LAELIEYNMALVRPEYESVNSPTPGRPSRITRAVVKILIWQSIGAFAIWCIADVFYVKVKKNEGLDYLFLLLPIGFFVCDVWTFVKGNKLSCWRSIAIAIGLTALAVIITVFLVLFLGIPFHFAIGGNL
jgi:hypothetical protein